MVVVGPEAADYGPCEKGADVSDAIEQKKKWCWSAVAGLIFSLVPGTILLLHCALDLLRGMGLGAISYMLLYFGATHLCLLMSVALCRGCMVKVDQKGTWMGVVGLVVAGEFGASLICWLFWETGAPALLWTIVILMGLFPAALELWSYRRLKRVKRPSGQALETDPAD